MNFRSLSRIFQVLRKMKIDTIENQASFFFICYQSKKKEGQKKETRKEESQKEYSPKENSSKEESQTASKTNQKEEIKDSFQRIQMNQNSNKSLILFKE